MLQDETLIEEESESPVKPSTNNHMTLRDVSAIEKETEMEIEIPQEDLSVSLLPNLPSGNFDTEKQLNKSIASTISDKTFVKTSLKPIISEEEDESDDDDTIMEQSFVIDSKEKARPLLLTADQSIRLPNRRSSRKEKLSLPNQSFKELPKIKQEKRSFHQAMETCKSYFLMCLSLVYTFVVSFR